MVISEVKKTTLNEVNILSELKIAILSIMEKNYTPKGSINLQPNSKKKWKEDDPGDAGKIYEAGVENNAQTTESRLSSVVYEYPDTQKLGHN